MGGILKMYQFRLGRIYFKTISPLKYPVRVTMDRYTAENGDEYMHITKDILAPKGTFCASSVVKTWKGNEVFRQEMSLTFETFARIAHCINGLKSMKNPEVVQEFINKYKEANEDDSNETGGGTN